MDTHQFVEGTPGDFSLSVESSLFHLPEHLTLQEKDHWKSFYLVDSNHRAQALVHFNIQEKVANSPARGPYGSYFYSPNLLFATAQKFVEHVNARLKSLGIKEVIIKGYPEFLSPQAFGWTDEILVHSGYSVVLSELSAFLPVTGNDLEQRLDKAQLRRLNKCREKNFNFRNLPPNQLTSVYNFILARRQEKKYDLSMSLQRVVELLDAFPERVKLFAVFDGERLVAASLGILERSDVLYDFYHDHDPNYDNVSPVVFLMNGMYNHCRENHIRTINLGTSTVDGRLNESLLDFKQSLGAIPSPKRTYKALLN